MAIGQVLLEGPCEVQGRQRKECQNWLSLHFAEPNTEKKEFQKAEACTGEAPSPGRRTSFFEFKVASVRPDLSRTPSLSPLQSSCEKVSRHRGSWGLESEADPEQSRRIPASCEPPGRLRARGCDGLRPRTLEDRAAWSCGPPSFREGGAC